MGSWVGPWVPFSKLSRQQAIETCEILIEQRDKQIRRAEAAETIIAECGCQTEAGWAEHERVRAMEAALARVLAVPACRDAGHTEALHIAAGCCDPYETPCAALRGPQDEACESEDDWCFTHNRKHFRCYTGRPQDERAASVCCYDGLRPCEYPQCAGPQRSAGSGRAAERVEGAIKLGANPGRPGRGPLMGETGYWPDIPGHERVWDVLEWVCQDCWEAGLPSKWPCAAVKGQRAGDQEGQQ